MSESSCFTTLMPGNVSLAFSELALNLGVRFSATEMSWIQWCKLILRKKRVDTAFRVAFLNNLHTIIGRRGRQPDIKRNKMDVALVSDYDCLDANVDELIESILRAEKLWPEQAVNENKKTE